MEEDIKVHVGLDVHKETIVVARAEAGTRQAGSCVGTIAHDLNKLLKLLARLGQPQELHVVYEAGPTGYGLQRALSERGYPCEMIAPTSVPKAAGQRIKTDRRDALKLAEYARAGKLQAVWIPQPRDESIRDLARAREDAVSSRTQARHQLKAFLLRRAVVYRATRTSWTKAFYRWLGELSFGLAEAQIAFTEYLLAVQMADQRVERLTQALEQGIAGWRFEPVVQALRALRGIDTVNAIGLVAEIGDLSRFEHPRKLMGYLGLVPAEHSSGDRTVRGAITRTGNAHARRLLTEAAWNYRFMPRIGRPAQQRQQDLPASVRALAWKAQLRLSRRFAALNARGVQRNKICVAVARELSGFVWAVASLASPPRAEVQPATRKT